MSHSNIKNHNDSAEKHLLKPEVSTYYLEDDGVFPNNAELPLLVYRQAVDLPAQDPAQVYEALLSQNGWGGTWRNGIFSYHHYHSTAHEVLGVYSGTARVQLGGDEGITVEVKQGDVIVLPAGAAHKNLGSSSDFGVVGGYPAGQNWDMNYGRAAERPEADENISQVPLPEQDPIYGPDGPLLEQWGIA